MVEHQYALTAKGEIDASFAMELEFAYMKGYDIIAETVMVRVLASTGNDGIYVSTVEDHAYVHTEHHDGHAVNAITAYVKSHPVHSTATSLLEPAVYSAT